LISITNVGISFIFFGDYFLVVAILSLTGPGMFTKTVREYFVTNNCEQISQAGIFFNDFGIFKMKGSGVRHDKFPSYTDIRNTRICL
jgi:hypothetical protein